jgi:hypothetical protein
MTEETGKGAWKMRTTISPGSDAPAEWETYWDPEATPMSEEEARVARLRMAEILFGPQPNDPR